MCLDRQWCLRPTRVWPTYLLHLQTLTVFRRGKDNDYGSQVEPPYAAISYTWNRFATGSYEKPWVKGISWRIPVIQDEHFTRETLREVLSSTMTGKHVQFCWIDIFCMDQSRDILDPEEVHRQSSIFANAANTFVWLSRTSVSDLVLIPQADVESTLGEHTITRSTAAHLVTIFDDPWFSSLWATQEAKPGSKIISREGSLVCHTSNSRDGGTSTTFMSLELRDISAYARLYVRQQATWTIMSKEQTLVEYVGSPLVHKVRNTGMLDPWLFNLNLLYQIASHKDAEPEERMQYIKREVFGIVPVSNTTNGQTDDVVHITKNSFQHELLQSMTLQSQLFIRTTRQETKPSWAISVEDLMPNAPFLMPFLRNNASILRTRFDGTSKPRISGEAIELQAFTQCLAPVDNQDTSVLQLVSVWLDKPGACCIVLLPSEDSTDYGNFMPYIEYSTTDRALSTFRALTNISGQHENTNEIILLPMSESRSEQVAESAYYVGLILEKCDQLVNQEGAHEVLCSHAYRRRGLCFWTVSRPDGQEKNGTNDAEASATPWLGLSPPAHSLRRLNDARLI